MTNEENKRKRKDRDIPLKIISVLIAVFVWFLIMFVDSPIDERSFTSITVLMKDANVMETNYQLSVIQNKTSTVNITVSGKRGDINRLKKEDISAYVDLSEITTAGEKSLPVQINDIDKVSVVSVTPSTLVVYIDKRSSKEIPVYAEIKQASFDSDVKVSSLVPEPGFITVTGPANYLKDIEYAKVDLFGLGKIEKAMYVTEQLKLIDKNGGEFSNAYVTTDISDIKVYIAVTTTKTVPLVLKYKYGYFNERNSSVQINPGSIEIEGSPDFLNTLSEINLSTIDERTIEDDIKLIYNIPLPEGVINKSGIGAAEVDIKFINSDKKKIAVNKSDIKVTKGEFDYLIKTEDISITLRGPVQDLSYISKSRITVSIDLSKITEKGVHSVPVTVSVNNGSTVYPIGEYFVNVEVY